MFKGHKKQLKIIGFFDVDHTLSAEYQQMPYVRDNMKKLVERYPQLDENEPYTYLTEVANIRYPHNLTSYMNQIIDDNDIFKHDFWSLVNYGRKIKASEGISGLSHLKSDLDSLGQTEFHAVSSALRPGVIGFFIEHGIETLFQSIYACDYIYDAKGTILSTDENLKVDRHDKARYVRKRLGRYSDTNIIPFSVGDGFSDIDMFDAVKEAGGFSILVDDNGFHKTYHDVTLLADHADFIIKRDFSIGMELQSRIIKEIRNRI